MAESTQFSLSPIQYAWISCALHDRAPGWRGDGEAEHTLGVAPERCGVLIRVFLTRYNLGMGVLHYDKISSYGRNLDKSLEYRRYAVTF